MSAMSLKPITVMLMWFVISTAIVSTNGFETYDETDQLAEESVGHEDDKQEKSTTNSKNNFSSDETMAKNRDKSDRSGIELSAEDEPNDPLQKILPKVTFNCKGKSEGYYVDNEFCEVFHYCKTNGFRFTFMCPPESYYNSKLMACEYNSTVSLCKHKHTVNQVFNITRDTAIDTSAGERVEVFDQNSTQNSVRVETMTSSPSTTSSSTPVMSDPYLTKWRTIYGSRNKPKENDKNSENINNNSKISPNNTNQFIDYSKPVNKTKPLETQTILPFRGFGRNNRTKNNRNNTSNENIVNSFKTSNNSLKNLTDNSVHIPSNAWPVINSLRNHYIHNSNQGNSYRGRTTTTSPPSLLKPTTRGPTTVSPFEYFSPIFDSENRFQPKTDLSSLSSQRNQNNLNQRPVLTQNYFNTIFHSPNNKSIENESQIKKISLNEDIYSKQSQTSEENSDQLKEIGSQEVIDPQVYELFKRRPIFDNIFEGLPQETDESSDSSVDTLKGSESQSLQSMTELIEKLKHFEDSNQEFKHLDSEETNPSMAETYIDPSDETDEESEDISRKRKKNKDMNHLVTIPLLVPTGISRTDLKRRLTTSLLKPTVIPLTESGQQIPAYVLQFQNSERSRETKRHRNRSKRQAFNWNNNNNPYLRNQFLRHSYYLPMNSMSSPMYSGFDNYIGNGLPMSAYNGRHLEIGEKPGLHLNPSAQHNQPFYVPPKQPFMPFPNNFNFDNNIYDLSEFSDFYSNPMNKKPNPLLANDYIPYRSVSLRRPSFKRPPRREKIPETKKGENETKKVETFTTTSPLNSVPVSPRPYSRSLPKRKYYTMNSNPFTDFSNENIGDIGEAIKLFDGNEDHFQPLSPTNFDSQPLFSYNSPQSFSNDFIPIPTKGRSFSSGLNGRSSRINTLSQSPVNTLHSNNYLSDTFPPLPQFGDSDYRLPYVDIPDPTLANLGFRPKPMNYNSGEHLDRKHDNSSQYSTQYSPESGFNTKIENSKTNDSERNPNHNYDVIDKELLQTSRTDNSKRNLVPILNSRLNWDNIVGQYNRQNTTVPKTKSNDNKSDQKEQNDSQMPSNQKYISYGTRLSGAVNPYLQNPTITVKTSIRAVSSLQPESSNQVIISKKLGTPVTPVPSQRVDNNDKSIDELYNRASDRLMLFNYYSQHNSLKPKPSTTTTASPLSHKYPSTSHWSIRGWTGHYYPSRTTTTTIAPMATTNKHFEIIDLFESEANTSETTTQLPKTTSPEPPEPPYKKVFNSHLGTTIESNANSKPFSFSQRTQSEISNYLNSLTSTHKSVLIN